MFALVESGNITQMPKGNKGITLNNIQYPPTIYTLWSESERNAIGIYTVEIDETNKKDKEYYINTDITYAFGSGKVTGSYGTATAKEIADKTVDGVVEKGLKTIKKELIDRQCASLLSSSDWMAVKAFEESGDVESGWKTWRANVRTKCNSMQTQITNASDVDALVALFTRDKDGVRPLGDFPVKE